MSSKSQEYHICPAVCVFQDQTSYSQEHPSGLNTAAYPLKELVQFDCILDQDDTLVCFPIVCSFRAYDSLKIKLIQGALQTVKKC